MICSIFISNSNVYYNRNFWQPVANIVAYVNVNTLLLHSNCVLLKENKQ